MVLLYLNTKIESPSDHIWQGFLLFSHPVLLLARRGTEWIIDEAGRCLRHSGDRTLNAPGFHFSSLRCIV